MRQLVSTICLKQNDGLKDKGVYDPTVFKRHDEDLTCQSLPLRFPPPALHHGNQLIRPQTKPVHPEHTHNEAAAGHTNKSFFFTLYSSNTTSDPTE